MPLLKSPRVIAPLPLILWLIVSANGCSTFSSVRSASVRPGYAFNGQVSGTTRPGPEAGWFFAFDCASGCDYPVVGAEAAVSYGWNGGRDGPAYAVGAGLNGFFPYVDGYVQLRGASPVRNAFGIGGRLGFPTIGWRQHQLYGRYDVALGPNRTLLLNPALFLHHGRAGLTSGSLVAFVQGVGVEFEGSNVSVTPSVSAVLSRAHQKTFNEREGPTTRAFATASIGISFHGAQRR